MTLHADKRTCERLLRRPSPEGIRRFLVLCALFIGAAARLLCARAGYNYDLESFWIVSDMATDWRNVYAETDRYNYAPGWYVVLGLVRTCTQALGGDTFLAFHLSIATLLTIVDAAIAKWLRRVCGVGSALAFYLNPVAILITGYHCQFDNVAVLLALLSWSGVRSAQTRTRVLSAVWLGLSLVFKHVFVFFPLWILLLPSAGRLRLRLLLAAIPYGVFASSFLPFTLSEPGRHGIMQNVFGYEGATENVLLNFLLALTVPNAWLDVISPARITMIAFVCLIVAAGIAFRERHEDEPEAAPLLYYMTVLVAGSPAMAPQYLVIPLVACAVFRRQVLLWCYVAAATAIVLASPSNIGWRFGNLFQPLTTVTFMHAQAALLCFVLLRLAARSRVNTSGRPPAPTPAHGC